MTEPCNHRSGPNGEPCEAPAEKYYVVTITSGIDAGRVYLHPRCKDCWKETALPTSPYAQEVTADEFAVWKVMLS